MRDQTIDGDDARGWIERECLLFEAGEYPDRGIVVTEADLADLAANSDKELPVRVEHLRESPFDSALGVVTRLRLAGGKLWGTLRQPIETWRFLQKAGARALSVAVDFGQGRLKEVSFVTRPRVAGARVFSEGGGAGWGSAMGRMGLMGLMEVRGTKEVENNMVSVRQFAEGLIGHLRGVVASDGGSAGHQVFHEERVGLMVEELTRRGYLRATDEVSGLARAILSSQETFVTRFGDAERPVAQLFAEFLEANGPVWPAGEMAVGVFGGGGGSGERLVAMARERAEREGVSFVAAFNRVSGENPSLALAARSEAAG